MKNETQISVEIHTRADHTKEFNVIIRQLDQLIVLEMPGRSEAAALAFDIAQSITKHSYADTELVLRITT